MVDAASGLPLGLSNLQLWTRAISRPLKAERDYQKEQIEAKESYKWIAAATGSAACFEPSEVAQVTYVGDSEADIYESWFQIPKGQVHLLVRACQDRRLVDSAYKLYETLNAQPIAGAYTAEIPAEPRHHRSARSAQMNVRYTGVKLRHPDRLNGNGYPEFAELTAIDVIHLRAKRLFTGDY